MKRIITDILLKFPIEIRISLCEFFSRFGISIMTDLVGYEVLTNFIKKERIYLLNGDFIEIGSFLGGGTIKLAHLAKHCKKKVYAIDIFNPKEDKTRDFKGCRMSDIYSNYIRKIFGEASQFEIYKRVTKPFDNIVTIKNDSKKVKFSKNQKFCFGFIDGNHDPKYVINDFYLVWNHLVPRGCVAFHDYNGDLPQVTNTVNKLIKLHKNSIKKLWKLSKNRIIILQKENKR